jgi:Bacterial protein of unknown function (DUF839)
MRARLALVSGLVLVVAAVAALTVPASASHDRGFKTAQDEMLDLGPAAPPGSSVEALITVGDPALSGGYRFEAIPDGIALHKRGGGEVDVFVNHETSTVPFPYIPTSPDEGESQNDFDNSQVSRLTLHRRSGGVLAGQMAITSAEGFQRLCSNYLATKREGFDRPILFTNEEAIDWVNRIGRSWPATIGASEARQAGVVVAYDVKTGNRKPIWGMGRFNHENSVAVPLRRFDGVTLLSSDDTFVSNPTQSQLYAYIADDDDDVLNDRGDLYAFVSDEADSYYDFGVNSTTSISGRFVRVPDFADDPERSIAHGQRANGTDVMSTDFSAANGYTPAFTPPPNDGTWQRDPNGIGIDGPQWVLEQWGDRNDVFEFVRLEDIAYDKRPGKSNIVYIADTGRGSGSAGANPFPSTNGRIWRLELDPADPTIVRSLRILVEGDNAALKLSSEIHQPDNLETARDGSLLVTEDPGSGNQFAPGEANATPARLWSVDLTTWVPTVADSPSKGVVAVVNQGADETAVDVDPADVPPIPPPAFPLSPGNTGAWESSGVVDASSVFGKGAFLVNVQAHTLWVEKAPGDINDVNPPPSPDFTYKREGGQLLLLRLTDGEDDDDDGDDDA